MRLICEKGNEIFETQKRKKMEYVEEVFSEYKPYFIAVGTT